MSSKDYLTVSDYAEDEFVEKKSRFIGYIAPAETEQQALDFIAEISKKHRDATHNTYAFILRDGTKRYSDNGEPQGTAGIPILSVLEKECLVDVCVVVTRYFGGIMLGAGGLVRAYSHGASIAVAAADIMHMTACLEILLECDYSMHGKLMYIFPDYNIKTVDTQFTSIVQIDLLIRRDRAEAFTKAVTELSNGQIKPIIVNERFEDMK